MNKISGAQAIVEVLRLNGVKYFFGMPGSTEPIYLEMKENAPEINPILVRDEKCGAHMADGYARVSYRPGVCTGCQGPGATNLISGIAEAYTSSVPVIAITASRPSAELWKHTSQELEQIPLFKPITKWAVKVESIGRTADIMHNAFRVAISGRPGPVNVEIPLDIIEGTSEIQIPITPSYQTFPNHKTRADADSIIEARDLLLSAKRPVIVAGGGVMLSQAWPELAEFVELTSIPVTTTITGKGAISEDHLLSVGVVGTYTRRCANEVVSQADLVLFVGCKTGAIGTNKWQIPKKGTKIIHADIDPLEIGRSYPTEVGLIGDAKLVLRDLTSSIREVQASRLPSMVHSYANDCREMKEGWLTKVEQLELSNEIPIKPPRVIREIQNILTPEDILVGDVGYSCVWTAAHYSVKGAGRKYIAGRGLAGLGFGFPAAIGAQLAAPQSRVVCVTGDCSFSTVIQELSTALYVNTPVVVVVLNNSCLNFERQYMKHCLGNVATCEFNDIDYGKVAQAFGCFGQRVVDPRDLRVTLEKALKAEKPAVVDVVVDRELVPPVTFFDKYVKTY